MLKFITILFIAFSLNSFAQETEENKSSQESTNAVENATDDLKNFLRGNEKERLKFYKEKYEAHFDKTFEDVYNAIITVLEKDNCAIMMKKSSQTDAGLLKGSIHSEYCVFVTGEASLDSMRNNSKNFPIIRGGDWTSGRMQYKFIIKEKEDGSTDVILRGEMSGREDNVTNLVHFWESSGVFETKLMEKLTAFINSN